LNKNAKMQKSKERLKSKKKKVGEGRTYPPLTR